MCSMLKQCLLSAIRRQTAALSAHLYRGHISTSRQSTVITVHVTTVSLTEYLSQLCFCIMWWKLYFLTIIWRLHIQHVLVKVGRSSSADAWATKLDEPWITVHYHRLFSNEIHLSLPQNVQAAMGTMFRRKLGCFVNHAPTNAASPERPNRCSTYRSQTGG